MNRKIAVFLASTCAAMGLASAATAADLPARMYTKAPAVVATYNWTGFYIGGHVGYGWSTTEWTFPSTQFFANAAGQGFRTRPEGFMGGVHGGYNYQVGAWVFGVEGSYDPTTLKETRVGVVTPSFPNDSFRTRIGDLVTATGRIGYTWGPWMLYGKGGYASAEVKLNALSGPPVPGITASVSSRRGGATAGVGTEYMITPNIILGVEYDWVGIDGRNFTSTVSNGGPFVINNRDTDIQEVTARVSFKFW